MSHWTLRREFRFEASHQLVEHDGKCARLHGHSWRGVLEVRGDYLTSSGPKQGMVTDYGDLGVACRALEDVLDHQHLNAVLGTDRPTSENIAAWCFKYVQDHFYDLVQLLSAVEISETPKTSCRYEPA